MGSLSPVHWAIVIVVVLLLFGSRKLPDMARGLGQSMRILKAESRAMAEDGRPSETNRTPESTRAPESNRTLSESTRTSGEDTVNSTGSTRPVAAQDDPPSAERHAS
ncbi:Sec-independent protein translocase subunit TatA [Actinomycetospora chiangmaiensis]|uniref:Sec-independent protein translocase subunit TatA n=1 Tax=Actinomycetospora chiangmaiensis TaxID=402650 RepID=UPI00039C597C|nr:Sec-independent protein translocase subunit TatA [Actinomycetospora chiangmaiensis]